MNMLQTVLLAAGVASMILLCIASIVSCGHLQRIADGVARLVYFVEQADQRQRAIMANIRNRNYDPQ